MEYCVYVFVNSRMQRQYTRYNLRIGINFLFFTARTQGFHKRNRNKIKMIACQSYIHNVACSCYVSLDYSIFGSFVNDTDVVLRSFLVEKHVFAL